MKPNIRAVWRTGRSFAANDGGRAPGFDPFPCRDSKAVSALVVSPVGIGKQQRTAASGCALLQLLHTEPFLPEFHKKIVLCILASCCVR